MRETLWDADRKVLLRRYRDGKAEIDGYAEDYAYMIFGLLELFQADPKAEWLEWAVALQERQDELFWDEAAGGWFSTTGEDSSVLLRMKEDYDGAEPSGNSVAALVLLKLGRICDRKEWIESAEKTLRLFAQKLHQGPQAVPHLLLALDYALQEPKRVVLVGDFNVAPEDRDVHDPRAWAGKVLCSAKERAALDELLFLGREEHVASGLREEAVEHGHADDRVLFGRRHQDGAPGHGGQAEPRLDDGTERRGECPDGPALVEDAEDDVDGDDRGQHQQGLRDAL